MKIETQLSDTTYLTTVVGCMASVGLMFMYKSSLMILHYILHEDHHDEHQFPLKK